MSQIRLFLLAALVCLPVTASSAPQVESSLKKVKAQLSGSIKRGNSAIGINSNGKITIHTPEGTIALPTDSLSTVPKSPPGPYAPCILGGPEQSVLDNPARLSPVYTPMPDPVELLNHIGMFFSTASGGFGSRINYDHKISPHTRFTASPEFLTYSLSRASTILGDPYAPRHNADHPDRHTHRSPTPLCAHIAYQSPCWIWRWPHHPPGSPLTQTGVLRE